MSKPQKRKLPTPKRARPRPPLSVGSELAATEESRRYTAFFDAAMKRATESLVHGSKSLQDVAGRLDLLKPPHPLEAIFRDAVDQVRKGKGDERHGRGQEFMKQTWLESARAHGSGFLTGQAEKKLRESIALPYPQRRSERLGVLVYTAMSILFDDLENGAGPKS